ncbi:MAG: ABC transporter ATP-binding protein, partial [Oligosphaeraceae bacterium]|nr:ABC transporter ATP-binding protein [Oligosphaeraceae bacterium]
MAQTKNDDYIITSRNLTKVYRMGAEVVHALRGISVDIPRGEYLSILGPSGSGKSTFFNLIGGLDMPTSGSVSVDGCNLHELNQRQLAWMRCHKMGYIFQSFNLIQTMTALENVALPKILAGASPEEARAAAAETLSVVGL